MEKLTKQVLLTEREISKEESNVKKEKLALKTALRTHEASIRAAMKDLEQDLVEVQKTIANLDDDDGGVGVGVGGASPGLDKGVSAEAGLSTSNCRSNVCNGENESVECIRAKGAAAATSILSQSVNSDYRPVAIGGGGSKRLEETCSRKTEAPNFVATTYAAKKTVLVDSSNLPFHHHVREPEHAIPHVQNEGISGGRGRGISNLPAWMTRAEKLQEIKVPSATKTTTSEQAALQSRSRESKGTVSPLFVIDCVKNSNTLGNLLVGDDGNPSKCSAGMCVGRGRGVSNLPAWMTRVKKQEDEKLSQALHHSSIPTKMNFEVTRNPLNALNKTCSFEHKRSVVLSALKEGTNVGRGRGISNLPAWMTRAKKHEDSKQCNNLQDPSAAAEMETEVTADQLNLSIDTCHLAHKRSASPLLLNDPIANCGDRDEQKYNDAARQKRPKLDNQSQGEINMSVTQNGSKIPEGESAELATQATLNQTKERTCSDPIALLQRVQHWDNLCRIVSKEMLMNRMRKNRREWDVQNLMKLSSDAFHQKLLLGEPGQEKSIALVICNRHCYTSLEKNAARKLKEKLRSYKKSARRRATRSTAKKLRQIESAGEDLFQVDIIPHLCVKHRIPYIVVDCKTPMQMKSCWIYGLIFSYVEKSHPSLFDDVRRAALLNFNNNNDREHSFSGKIQHHLSCPVISSAMREICLNFSNADNNNDQHLSCTGKNSNDAIEIVDSDQESQAHQQEQTAGEIMKSTIEHDIIVIDDD